MKYFFEKLLSRKVIFCLSFLAGVVIFVAPTGANAASILYVNADSNGVASHPTRAFGAQGYSANDSYNTLSQAYAAAVNGDTIEISGGASGKSYLGHSSSIQKALTIQGSSVPGFNGPVTITYVAALGYAINLNASGIVLQHLIVSGSSLGIALRVDKGGVTVRNVTAQNPGNDSFPLYINTGTGNSTINFENTIFKGSIAPPPNGSQGIYVTTSGNTTVNFNNCDIVNVPSRVLRPIAAGVTLNFTNCIFALNNTFDGLLVNFGDTPGAVVNIDHSAIEGWVFDPHVTRTKGAGALHVTNNLDNVLPTFQKTAANLGFIALSTDDTPNIDYFTSIANYAKNTYGIPLTFYANFTNTLSDADKVKLQTLVKNGHEVGAHTRDHNDLSLLNAINITYSGTSTNQAFVVSASGTALSVMGSADTFDVNLASGPGSTIGGLCTVIESHPNYACAPTVGNGEPIHPETPSLALKDASTLLPRNVLTGIPFDDSTGANNRYFNHEILGAIQDLETAIRLDPSPATASYTVKTMAFPFHEVSPLAFAWVKAHTNLIGLRANDNDSLGDPRTQGWLGNIDVFNAYFRPSASSIKGPDYSTLTAAQKQARIQEGARAIVSYASAGFFSGALSHDEVSDLSISEWQTLLDELVKYRVFYNLKFDTFANLITNIKTSGQWTNAGGGIWTRSFAGVDDLRLAENSPLINAGVSVAGRTTDYLGNAIVGAPDIGAYEFGGTTSTPDVTPPTVPGTPSAATPGTDNTPTWNWAASTDTESGLKLYTVFWSTSSTFGTNVTSATTTVNTFTHTTPLADGTWYFKVKATDNAGNSSIDSNNGSIAIITTTTTSTPDTTPPSVPGTPSSTTPGLNNKPNWVWAASTDTGSGLDFYTVSWSTSSTFGAGVSIATTTANTFTHSTPLADGTWYLRVKATDKAGNTSGNSNNGSIIISTTTTTSTPDVTPPTVPGTPSSTTPGSNNKPNWVWAASTDTGSGLAFYTVSWSPSSTFGSGVSTATTTANTFTHSTALADGTWYFRVKATDHAGNTSGNSNNGSIIINTTTTTSTPDVTPPTVPGTPSSTTPGSNNKPNWVWAASTDTSSGLDFYTVSWSTSSTFGAGVSTATTTANTFTHSTALADGTWYFRVKATDHAGNASNYSNNGLVIINTTTTTSTPDVTPPTVPGTPSSTTPGTDNTPTWVWGASTDTSSGLAFYTVSWSNSSTFGAGVSTATTTANTYTNSTALIDGTWFFRVSATDFAGNQSANSSNGLIVINTTTTTPTPTTTPDVTPPTVPGTPGATTPGTNNLPTWIWTASTDASSSVAGYLVAWSQDAGFASGVSTSTVTTSSYTHTTPLPNGTWYFRVQAFDAAGNYSAPSNNGSIVIAVSNGGSIGGGGGGGNGGGGGGVIGRIFRDLFRFKINKDNRGVARSRHILLKLFGGAAKRMAISNSPDFPNAVQEPFTDTRDWDLCSGQGSTCREGAHTVYVKFFNSEGDTSPVVTDTVVLDTATISETPKPGKHKVLGVKIVALKRTLGVGSRGSDVVALQNFLKGLGYFSDKANGMFGKTTRSAVSKYQGARGIKPANGLVGKLTRQALLKGL